MLGLNENRRFALIDSDRAALAARISTYLDPDVPMAQVDPRLSANHSRFDPEKVRKRLLDKYPFDERRILPFQFRPLDMRYAYVETRAKLWNESRPPIVAAAAAASGFLLARRRAPRALDGAALHFSDCLVDQKVLFTDAYAIPFWLSAGPGADDSDAPSLFDPDAGQPTNMWKPICPARRWPTCSNSASTTQRPTRRARRWSGCTPRHRQSRRFTSSRTARPCERLAPHPVARHRASTTRVGGARRAGGGPAQPSHARYRRRCGSLRPLSADSRCHRAHRRQALNPGEGDLALTAGWGIVQSARLCQAPASTTCANIRSDTAGLTNEDREALGEQVLDIYLNDHALLARGARGSLGLQDRRLPGTTQVAELPRQARPRPRPHHRRGPRLLHHCAQARRPRTARAQARHELPRAQYPS